MPDADTRSIHDFYRHWSDALVGNDAAAIGRFMAPGWIIVGADGVTTKGDFLHQVECGDLTHDRMDFANEPQIHLHGDFATVTGRIVNSGAFRGHGFTADEWTTDVLVRSGDGWRCALTHITAVRR